MTIVTVNGHDYKYNPQDAMLEVFNRLSYEDSLQALNYAAMLLAREEDQLYHPHDSFSLSDTVTCADQLNPDAIRRHRAEQLLALTDVGASYVYELTA